MSVIYSKLSDDEHKCVRFEELKLIFHHILSNLKLIFDLVGNRSGTGWRLFGTSCFKSP